MNFKKTLILLAILVSVSKCVYPQTGLRFDKLSIDEGLSYDIVTSIIQDKYGFIWVGTEDGLNKYDGYNFTIYKHNPSNPHSIKSNWITDLIIDDEGNLWIANSKGISRFDYVTSKFVNYDVIGTSVKPAVNYIFIDKTGQLLAGTEDNGLIVYDPAKDKFTQDGSYSFICKYLDKHIINYIYQETNNLYWIATDKGLIKWNQTTGTVKRFMPHPDRESLPDYNFVSSILDLASDNLWISTFKGLMFFNKKEEKFVKNIYKGKDADQLNNDLFFKYVRDSQGNIWAAGFRGLFRIEPKTLYYEKFLPSRHDSYSLSAIRIYDVFEDSGGILWIGTYKGGISKMAPVLNNFYYLLHNPFDLNSLSGENVRTITKDNSGSFWFGCENAGITKYYPASREFTRLKIGGLEKASVNSLAFTNDGTLWAGTYNKGLYAIDPLNLSYKRYHFKELIRPGEDDVPVRYIYNDNDGELWVGTERRGLFRYNKTKDAFIQFTLYEEGLTIQSVFQDTRGDIWIACFGGGLYRYSKKYNELIFYGKGTDSTSKINSDAIYAVFEDSRKRIWVTTFKGGISLFNRESDSFTAFTETDGMPTNYIKTALEDNNGNLWLSHNKGLSRLNPSDMSVVTYTRQNGLRFNEFLSGSYFKDTDGTIYLGGVGGVMYFRPDRIKQNHHKPSVVFTNFKVFDSPVNPDFPLGDLKKIKLNYDQNFFSFEFTSTDYTSPVYNQYAYKLEGIDPDWIYSGNRRYVSYANVKPGNYKFLVKGSNSDGIWSEVPAEIDLSIIPPYWMTWWFRGLVILAVLLLVVIIYQYRVNRLLEIEKLRTKIAADLHDEIASNLSSIAMFGKIIGDEAKSGQINQMSHQLLDRITSLSQESVVAIREIIWAIDPKPETIHSLLIRIRDAMISSCRAKNITLNFDVPSKEMLPEKNLTAGQRKSLWLFLKEALNNAIRHSSATEIYLISLYDGEELKIVVKDNGTGFDSDLKFAGKGLDTMKIRAADLNGTIEIGSQPAEGTTIILTFRI